MEASDKQIMLVDDDPDDLELYVELFRAIDPEIELVKYLNPVEALDFLRRSTRLPDQAILDFNMPGMTGLEFLKLVRADVRLLGLRVAVVTTGCSPNDEKTLRQLGVECYRKAPRFEDFRVMLQRIVLGMH